jgi:hypothetical protein
MLELQFDDNSPKMDLENTAFITIDDNDMKENNMEDVKKHQISMNIHNQFQTIFKSSFERLLKKPDVKSLEKLLEV